MMLKDKVAIVLGERDSVPGEAIAACLASAGVDVAMVRTECFV
jgi:glycine/sarcosine/betaine reductase complex component A